MNRLKKYRFPLLLLIILGVYSCASTGQPDGGAFDEEPPKFVKSTPMPFAVNNENKKIAIEFDEFVKIEKAAEKVVISPPQLTQPEIKASGKRILVNLEDSLKANTTYTIDFGDAIVDNNEGNPLGNYAFTFSTGTSIDTMEVSGTVLNAKDLEPIKGMQVGLHSDLNDSAFIKKPFDRVGRTDSRGRFSIRGVAPGKYRIYALMDGNQNYMYDSKTELIAFSDSIIIPRIEGAERGDTVWKDSTHVDSVKMVKYTRFLPDDIILKAFKAENDRQYLTQTNRDKENHFIITFSAKADSLPKIKGLNFDEKDAFIIENTPRNDSICYWIKDSLIYHKDTLEMKLDYMFTDSLGKLVPKSDTIFLANKYTREQRAKFQKKAEEDKAKEDKKREKSGEKILPQTPFLKMTIEAPSTMDLDKNIILSFEEPILKIDTSAIHLDVKVDSLWKEEPFIIMKDSVLPRTYEILAAWKPDMEYQLTMDSVAITGLYGLHTDKVQNNIKIKKLEDYGTIYLNILGVHKNAVAQLIDNAGKVLREQKVSKDGTADFYFLNPGTKYYIRLFNDDNNNGVWDPGNFEKGIQAEDMFYFPKSWEMKANFEFNETWDVNAIPSDKQKLDEIKKQKPDEAKKIKDRNKERARKLGR